MDAVIFYNFKDYYLTSTWRCNDCT